MVTLRLKERVAEGREKSCRSWVEAGESWLEGRKRGGEEEVEAGVELFPLTTDLPFQNVWTCQYVFLPSPSDPVDLQSRCLVSGNELLLFSFPPSSRSNHFLLRVWLNWKAHSRFY